MIQTENMEFQSENGYAEQLNLFQMESRSDLLLKEQEYIQTSRLLLLVISGCLIFIGIMNFLNVRVTDMLLRKKECAIMNRVGMTRKQLQAYVPCGRNVYLAVAECSSGNNGNVVDRRDWMVHENKDFLFCILLSAERNGRNITVVISSQSGNSRNPISKSSYEK